MIVYGISTCDTCKKAVKALEKAGHAPEFRDVRANPLSEAEIAELIAAFGGAIINQKSTTWRSASDWLKASEPDEQLKQQPTLMKRPVIRSDTGLTLGWDDAIQAKYL